MMRRIVPQWIWQMPFGEAISPVFLATLLLATVGIGVFLAGILVGDVRLIAWGIVMAIPFLFFLFLLWRTYQDDGYDE